MHDSYSTSFLKFPIAAKKCTRILMYDIAPINIGYLVLTTVNYLKSTIVYYFEDCHSSKH